MHTYTVYIGIKASLLSNYIVRSVHLCPNASDWSER